MFQKRGRKSFILLIILFTIIIIHIILLSSISVSDIESNNQKSLNVISNEILLKSRRFVPDEGITQEFKEKIKTIPERAHVLIQLNKNPSIEERKMFEARGIKLLSYIPNNAWLASIASKDVEAVSQLSDVRFIDEILPEDKLSPAIRERGIGKHAINEDGTVSLSADEINQSYMSNLYKYNTNNWALYVNQSDLKTGTYTYYSSAEDIFNNVNQTEIRNITKT